MLAVIVATGSKMDVGGKARAGRHGRVAGTAANISSGGGARGGGVWVSLSESGWISLLPEVSSCACTLFSLLGPIKKPGTLAAGVLVDPLGVSSHRVLTFSVRPHMLAITVTFPPVMVPMLPPPPHHQYQMKQLWTISSALSHNRQLIVGRDESSQSVRSPRGRRSWLWKLSANPIYYCQVLNDSLTYRVNPAITVNFHPFPPTFKVVDHQNFDILKILVLWYWMGLCFRDICHSHMKGMSHARQFPFEIKTGIPYYGIIIWWFIQLAMRHQWLYLGFVGCFRFYATVIEPLAGDPASIDHTLCSSIVCWPVWHDFQPISSFFQTFISIAINE